MNAQRYTYVVPWAEQPTEQAIQEAPKAWLKHWYIAGDKSYTPRTLGQLLRTPFGLFVRMVCFEKTPMAIQCLPNSPVCTDSCMEFFLNPMPEQNSFLNFEVNAKGTMLLGLNENGNFRCLDPSMQAGCFTQVKVVQEKSLWEARFCISDKLIQNFFKAWIPTDAKVMRGNFYKCGDKTKIPHYGSWNEVTRRPIDFHCPECFGNLILEPVPN